MSMLAQSARAGAAALAGLSAMWLGPAKISPASAATPPAEFFNEFDYAPTAPTPGPTNFEIVFAGNVTCQIPPQNQNDVSTDPFPNPNPITIVYDNAPNTTTVTFSGSALTPGQRYHFGLNQGFAPTPALQVISKVWTYTAKPRVRLPIVTVAPSAVGPGPYKYEMIYLEASFSPPGQGIVYGSWYEVPYTPAAPDAAPVEDLIFTNYSALKQAIYITNSGIQMDLNIPAGAAKQCAQSPVCKINTALLNRLDFTYEPPPGQPNSKFVPIVPPPPAMLNPTQPNKTGFKCP